MTLRPAGLRVGLVLFTMMLPASAGGAPRRDTTTATTTKDNDDSAVGTAAKLRYAEGMRLYTKRKYEEARVAFFQANALKRRPATVLMLGLTAVKLGRWLDAVRELDAYAAEVGDLPPKLREVIESARREAKSHVGRVHLDVPEGSEVTIDDEAVANLREPIDVVAGKHTIVIKHRDEKKTQVVEVFPESTLEVKPAFVPKALIPTADTRTRPTLPPRPESTQETQTSLLAPPQTTWPVYVLGAVGLGGLATAAIFGGLTANSNHAVDVSTQTLLRNGKSTATCSAAPVEIPYGDVCETLQKNERLARTHQSVFLASATLGASATTIAFIWFFFAPKAHDENAPAAVTRVVPWGGLGSGGATLERRF